MSIWEALLLGLVQGVTEFLPISSSGHLVLQQFFGWHESGLTFDMMLHMATLAAIIAFFGKSLLKVSKREWILVLIGTIPAGVVGVLLKDQIEALFASDNLVGWELVITGVLNLVVDRKLALMARATKEGTAAGLPLVHKQLSWLDSIIIGVGQAIAIIPGISRSGTTVAAGIFRNVEREEAFRFSFLLAIPALAGAGILQLKDVTAADMAAMSWPAVLVGCAAALVAGFLSLSLFKWVIAKARLEWFGWYCIVVGLAAILWLR